MTRSRPHLGIIAAALLLALVVLVLRGFEGREPTHGEEQSSISAPIENGRSSATGDDGASGSPGSSEVSRVRIPSANDVDEAGEDAETAGGSWRLAVFGVVENADGRPLSGVTVWIDRFSSSNDLSDEDLERSWNGRAWSDEVEESLMRRPHRAVTDSAGNFEIDGLPEGRVRLRASKTNYEIVRATTELTRVGERTRLIASPKRSLGVTVRFPDGSIAEMARLQITRGDWKHEEDWFEEDPELILVEGSYDLSAIAIDPSRDSKMRSPVQRIMVRERNAPVELMVEPAGSIRLNVVGWNGRTGEDSWRSACVPAGLIPVGTKSSEVEQSCRSFGVPGGGDLEANARFDVLARGSYDVYVFPFRDLPYFLKQSCAVEQALVELEFHLDRVALPTALTGTIRCPLCENQSRLDASCVDSLRLTANVGDSSFELESTFYRGLLPDGRILIVPRLDDWRDLGSGAGPDSLTVWARSWEHGRGGATLRVNSQPFAIDLGSSRLASLTIAVRNARSFMTTANRTLVARVVPTSIAGIDTDYDLGTRVTLDGDGIAVLDRLDPGEYTVTLTEAVRGSIEDLGVTVAAKTITVEADSRVEFDVPQLDAVDLILVGSLDNAYGRLIQLDRGGGARWFPHLSVGEVLRVDSLPAGRFEISAWGDDLDGGPLAASAEFDIPTQSIIRLDLGEPNCVRVLITDADGWLSRVGFHDGDTILPSEGVEFDWDFGERSERGFLSAWNSVERWTVLRNGSERVVERPNESAGIISPLGGTFVPFRIDR